MKKMGSVGGTFKSLFGGGSSAPKTSAKATQEVEEVKKKSARSRSALFMTGGEAAGEDLSEGQVRKRDSLFGN